MVTCTVVWISLLHVGLWLHVESCGRYGYMYGCVDIIVTCRVMVTCRVVWTLWCCVDIIVTKKHKNSFSNKKLYVLKKILPF